MEQQDDKRSGRLVRFLRTGLIYAMVILFGAVVGNLWMTRDHVTGAAPVIAGSSLDGQAVRIDYAEFDGPVLVYFFADWCPICKVQNSAIDSLSADYPMIPVAMQSGSPADIKAYMHEQDLDWPVVNDASGRVSRDFSVFGVPASFIVDREGQIRSSTRGYTSQVGLRVRLWMVQRGWM